MPSGKFPCHILTRQDYVIDGILEKYHSPVLVQRNYRNQKFNTTKLYLPMMMLDDDDNGEDDVEDDDDYAPAHDDAGQLAGCVHPDPPPPRIQPLLLCEKNITNYYCVASKISRHCHCIASYPLLPFEGNFNTGIIIVCPSKYNQRLFLAIPPHYLPLYGRSKKNFPYCVLVRTIRRKL